MPCRATVATRLALVLLLMCAVVCAQAASLDQFHHHSTEHCCGLCHAGMPFLRSAPIGPTAPVAPGGWIEKAWFFDAPHDVLLTAGSSRAPPVAFSPSC